MNGLQKSHSKRSHSKRSHSITPFLVAVVAATLALSACTGDSTATDSAATTAAAPGTSSDTGSDDPDNTIGSRGEGDTGTTTSEASETTTVADSTTTSQPADPQAPRVVSFEPGASAAVVSDAVVRGNRHTYTIAAGQGQTMELLITSLEDNAVFDLLDPSGNVLEQGVTNSTTVLPADGVYRVVVGGTRGNASYELTIVIPPGVADTGDTNPGPGDSGPEAIRFGAGETGATVTGQVQDANVKRYTIDVSAGQTMTFSITTVQNNGLVTVVAPSGTIVVTDATLDEFVLAESGEYQILVTASAGQATYELTVNVL